MTGSWLAPNAVVAVTGAAGSIGAELCRVFLRAGCRVAALDLPSPKLDELIASLSDPGGQVMAVPCNVTDRANCISAMEALGERWGGIDVLIANAGISHIAPFSDTTIDVVRKIMEVNFFGTVNSTQAALPSLRQRRGQIVVVTSVAGFAPLLHRSAYAASKHALHGCYDTLRAELEPDGVGVTLVCPSFTGSGVQAKAADGSGAWTTTGEISTPLQVAEAVYRGVAHRSSLVLPSRTAKMAWRLSRLAPMFYARMMARRLRAASSS